jgi:hypothetical protein
MMLVSDRTASDVWTFAFFAPLTAEDDRRVPTSKVLLDHIAGFHTAKDIVSQSEAFAVEHRFFHWRLEFPDVFERGGFDVLLGNPPWEKIKLEEQEHWADDPYICDAPTKAERSRRIGEYRNSLNAARVARVGRFESAKHYHEAISKFVRLSGRWPLTAVGDINTYALFAELVRNLISPTGRVGIVVPINIATDDTTKEFFSDVVNKRTLVRLVGFENEAFIFPAVHHAFKFCALVISGPQRPVESGDLIFFCRTFEHIEDSRRRFQLTAEDFELINPNTHTCPVFRTRIDAELTRKMYQRTPVLVNSASNSNPWGVECQSMFHMSGDSELFMGQPSKNRSPLYEAKMFWHFDHRFATYEGAQEANMNSGILPQPSPEQKANLTFRVLPRYWVESHEVRLRIAHVPPALVQAVRAESEEMARAVLLPWWCGYAASQGRSEDAEKLLQASVHVDLWNMNVRGELTQYMLNAAVANSLQDKWPLTEDDMKAILPCRTFLESAHELLQVRCPEWLIAFRDITNSTNERTAIFTFIPAVASGHNAPVLYMRDADHPKQQACMVANLSSLALDFVARQKIGGTHMSFFILNQLPIFPPSFYSEADTDFISSRAARLVCTSDDLNELASALGIAPSPWNEKDRVQLRAELDAYYAHLYGLTRDELRYILDPKEVFGDDFPSETFRVLKEREQRELGEYRTRRLVLEAFDTLAESSRFQDEMPKRESGQSISRRTSSSVAT